MKQYMIEQREHEEFSDDPLGPAGEAAQTVLFRVDQVAEVLNVSPQMIRKLINSRRVAIVRIGRAIRIPRGEVLRLCAPELKSSHRSL